MRGVPIQSMAFIDQSSTREEFDIPGLDCYVDNTFQAHSSTTTKTQAVCVHRAVMVIEEPV